METLTEIATNPPLWLLGLVLLAGIGAHYLKKAADAEREGRQVLIGEYFLSHKWRTTWALAGASGGFLLELINGTASIVSVFAIGAMADSFANIGSHRPDGRPK